MKFREHRGQFDDSMKTLVEVDGFAGLVKHLATLLYPYYFEVRPEMVHVAELACKRDPNTGWAMTYIVTIDGYGVAGFSDEPAGAP